MQAREFPLENIPSARYPCENQACAGQGAWPPDTLRWSPGGEDGDGTAWRPGFYCGACEDDAPQGGGENAPTLAEELTRRSGFAGERVDDANAVKLQLVGTLLCFPFDVEQWALLIVDLVDADGKPEDWAWKLAVIHDWPNTECLPCDLVSVEGHLTANGEGEPMLEVSRVQVLRQDITGERRRQLLQCEDPLERWDRARRMSRMDSGANELFAE